MAQLETSGSHRPSSIASDSFASSPGLSSPDLPSSNTLTSSEDSPATERNRAVEDWIAKAKQSFQEFDGYIGIGGAGLPKSYFVAGDLENPESSDEDDYVNVGSSDEGDDDYEIAVEHFDGEDEIQTRNYVRQKSSTSSLGTDGPGVPGHRRRRKSSGSSKPAVLPGGAAPFGLFGELSLKTSRRRGSSVEAEEEDKAPGIANTNFFRSSKCYLYLSFASHISTAQPAPAPESVDNRLANFEHQMPQILTRGFISPKEAEQLFQM